MGGQWFSNGYDCSPGDVRQSLETFLISTARGEGVLPASSGQRPGMALSVWRCASQPLTTTPRRQQRERRSEHNILSAKPHYPFMILRTLNNIPGLEPSSRCSLPQWVTRRDGDSGGRGAAEADTLAAPSPQKSGGGGLGLRACSAAGPRDSVSPCLHQTPIYGPGVYLLCLCTQVNSSSCEKRQWLTDNIPVTLVSCLNYLPNLHFGGTPGV